MISISFGTVDLSLTLNPKLSLIYKDWPLWLSKLNLYTLLIFLSEDNLKLKLFLNQDPNIKSKTIKKVKKIEILIKTIFKKL